MLQQYAGFQAEHGLDKPIWLVETNAAPSTDPAWPVPDPTFRVSLLEQAAYMPQGIGLALAAGAQRVEVYKLLDTPGDVVANPEPFGLVRADGTPRPAFITTRVAFAQLAGVSGAWWNEQGVVSQVVLQKPGSVTRLLWARVTHGQVAHIPALATSATVTDMWGNQSTVPATDGTYQLVLYGGECQQTVGDYCMIGGPPLYVTESAALDTGSLPTILSFEPLPDITSGDHQGGWLRWVLVAAGLGVAAGFELLFRRQMVRAASGDTRER